MSEGRLQAAVLGLEDKGRLLLEGACGLDYFRIAAVADRDSNLVGRTAEQYGCTPYDDYRQFVMQNQFDCLLVGAGLYSCEEHIRTAIKKKFHILKVSPLGRNFEEAASLVRLAESADVKFAVANPRQYERSFLALRQFLREKGVEQVFLITAGVGGGEGPCPAWQMDPRLAGGGVLLNDCYGIIDQIVWNFGLPRQVYLLRSGLAADKQQRDYLTEDTAVVTMKFGDNFIANVIGSRCNTFGPGEESLVIYGKDKSLAVGGSRFAVSDGQGQTIEQVEFGDGELCGVTRQLENFALSILMPDKNILGSTARENLKNMAVIESAYLSARTGFPEQPGRLLHMAGFGPSEIWSAGAS